MMITKKIQIEFADPRIRAIDCIQDIRKAAENAGLNLFSRFGVQLQYPMPTDDNKVTVDIRIPEKMAGGFSVGHRLRGISNYLLNRCGGRYQQYLVGNRLLNYLEASDSERDSLGLPKEERYNAIVTFTKLLERTDDEALELISRILVILGETEHPEKITND